MNGLQRAIDIKGSQAALADALGVKQQHVSYWLQGKTPGEHVLRVCESVEWAVRPNDIRPDLYPHPDDGLPAERRSQVHQVAA